jgi:hypothetical protein
VAEKRVAGEADGRGWRKVNDRFDADLEAVPASTRFGRLGYTSADSDADGDMGSRAATGG